MNEIIAKNRDCGLKTGYEHLVQVSGSGKIRRPPNAFMLFARDNRKKLSQEYPCETNKSISTILGQKWKNSPNEVKQRYYDLAKNIDLYHKRLYPEYSYNPKQARILKKERLRLKNEKPSISEELPKNFLHETASSSRSHLLNYSLKADRKSDVSSNQGESVDSDECTSNALKSSQVSIKTEKDSEYNPPDLGNRTYPLIGAMDDPPSHLLPSTVDYMRSLVAAAERNQENPIERSNEMHNCSDEDDHFPGAVHQPIPFVYPRAHRPGSMYHPFYYGRHFALPVGQSQEEMQLGDSGYHCSSTDTSLLATGSHNYVYDGSNGRFQGCPCSVCKRGSPFHYDPSFYPSHIKEHIASYGPCMYKPKFLHHHGLSTPHPFHYHTTPSPATYTYNSHHVSFCTESSVSGQSASIDSSVEQGTYRSGMVPSSSYPMRGMDFHSQHFTPYQDRNSDQGSHGNTSDVELQKRAFYQYCEAKPHVNTSSNDQSLSSEENYPSSTTCDVKCDHGVEKIYEKTQLKCEPGDSDSSRESSKPERQ